MIWGLLAAYLAGVIAVRLLIELVDSNDLSEEGQAASWIASALWLPILAIVLVAVIASFVLPPPRRNP